MSRRRDTRQPGPVDPAVSPNPVEGVIVGDERSRSGEDVRKRGWFWHWNAIVTQFAPLVGLKGVGLLNSYTVWTDRREESPHRGYAFPSQQSEADFYGEDRAELITINKILVALDLIEIRKEMVLRVDEAGRRWRVPHNLYRVKDRDDGFSLTADAVDRVVQLAAGDRAVYRYIRHIFSPKFKPIDANNVWTGILATLSTTPTWAMLAARAAQEEARASARTKAGHRSRKGAAALVDAESAPVEQNDSPAVRKSEEEKVGQTIVATTNKGSDIDVAPVNKGLARNQASSVAPASEAGASAVAPVNTTYHQTKTTTTTDDGEKAFFDHDVAKRAPEQVSFGPGGSAAPADRAGQEAALRVFHDANHREATIAERKLLRDLAKRFEPAARECGVAGRQSGWQWVAAAIIDAVDAGSAYVAPRRVREIMSRWEREGLPGDERRESTPVTRRAEKRKRGEIALGPNARISLPHGRDSGNIWATVAGMLEQAIAPERLGELIEGTFISGYEDGEILLRARDERQAARLAGEFRAIVERKLGEAMRRPVRLSVVVEDREVATPAGRPWSQATPDDPPPPDPLFAIPELGLSSAQVWQAVLDDVQRAGAVTPSDLEAWLRTASLIGRLDERTFVAGAPNETARRRIAQRFARSVEAALSTLLGFPCTVETVMTREWLRQQAEAEPKTATDADELSA
jgi:hypothetical protein